MTLVVLLFAVGILLLALEVIVPGAVLGIVGGVVMLIGVLVAFDQFGPGGGAIATAAGLGLGGLALYLEFVLLPKSRLAKRFSMSATVNSRSQPAVAARDVVGRRAVAVTTLAPSGVIECEGRRYEAFARSGHVAAGTTVEIIDIDNFRVIVNQPSNSQPPS